MSADENFVRQNGFADADAATCAHQFPALMFQPRTIAAVVAIGIVTQAWQPFAMLSAILCWNVALPRLNPFDAFFNRFVAQPKGRPPLPPAIGPRLFAQSIAATTTGGAAVSLYFDLTSLAFLFQAGVVMALTMLLVGRLCLGSYFFHLLKGQAAFANRTLPWAKP
jgi:hypothetical protein